MDEEESGPKKIRDVDFTDKSRTNISAKGDKLVLEYGGWEQLTPDVRVRTLKFKGVDPAKKDGALVEIRNSEKTKKENKFGHTPVQLVESNTIFNEVPLTNRLVFLSQDTKGEVTAYLYDSSQIRDKSFMFEVGKGSVMCWFTLEPDLPAEFLEYEEPGFSQSILTDIEPDSEQASEKFWKIFHQLENGQTENTVIPIYDISSETS